MRGTVRDTDTEKDGWVRWESSVYPVSTTDYSVDPPFLTNNWYLYKEDWAIYSYQGRSSMTYDCLDEYNYKYEIANSARCDGIMPVLLVWPSKTQGTRDHPGLHSKFKACLSYM